MALLRRQDPNEEGTFSMSSSHSPDTLTVVFDDTQAVANAGLVITATLAQRLGIERLVDGNALVGNRMKVSGGVFLDQGFTAAGAVRLPRLISPARCSAAAPSSTAPTATATPWSATG